ncbi:ig-like domain-containing protein [Trichonephila clavipes]|uniref:Ig-like domain-containing protein n=1 Tax=Trichonephila clavipes TaxID=2585209 RepID=A0A8X6SX88_TRICX|nr:ig-like domain-containing protein [Trichonephila clavipes]
MNWMLTDCIHACSGHQLWRELGRSSNGSVYIRDISHLTAGIYKCEVSADAPSFQTVSAEKSMSVQESASHAEQEADRSSVNILLLTMLLILQWRYHL